MRRKLFKNFLFFLLGGSAGCLFVLLILTAAVLEIKKRYHNRIYPGIFIFGNSVSGKNISQLEEFLSEKEKEINQRKLIFFWSNSAGLEKRWEIVPQMINWSLDKQAIINESLTKGREGNVVSNLAGLYRLLIFPLEIKPSFNYDSEKLEQIITQVANEIDRPVQEALFEFKEGKVVNFQVSKEGREVERPEVKKLIILAFSRPPDQKPLLVLDLPVKTVVPKITTDQSNNLGIKEFLAEGESFFKDSIPGRVHNIILASSYLHGVVISPGETFSFVQKIGTISAERGYKKAYVIKKKQIILEDGGGVCQVSTTFFRTALNAGLPIVERRPHYYRVGFYEQGGYPPGLDATVYPPSPDLKFKNDTPAHLLIQTVVDKEAKRLAIQLYGTADGRRVEINKPIIHSQTSPPEPVYLDEPSLKIGTTRRLNAAHWGAKVSFQRKVFTADGQLKEEQTFWSNYIPLSAVYQRGVGQ